MESLKGISIKGLKLLKSCELKAHGLKREYDEVQGIDKFFPLKATKALPTIEAIAPDTSALPIEKSLPDKVSSDAIAATKSKITYRLNNDGSIILRSLKGNSQESFKHLSDEQLEAIGLFREQRIGGDKYFEILDEGRDRKVKETKTITGKRFTVKEAIAYVTQKTGKPLGEKSFTQNAKKYGFAIRERGSGLYALIKP